MIKPVQTHYHVSYATDHNSNKNPITGRAKVCDGKTGECWEVRDGKKGETPAVKKETKKPETTKKK